MRNGVRRRKIIIRTRHDLVAEQRVGLPSEWPLKIPNYVILDLEKDMFRSKQSRGMI